MKRNTILILSISASLFFTTAVTGVSATSLAFTEDYFIECNNAGLYNWGKPIEDIRDYYPVGKAYSIANLNVRDKPSKEGNILRTLSPGEEITVKGYCDDWAETETGYCYAGYLSSIWKGEMEITGDTIRATRYIGYAYEQFCKLPDTCFNLVREYQITLSEEKIENVSGQQEGTLDPSLVIAGRTHSGHLEKRIWLRPTVEVLQTALFHEAGHVYDHNTWLAGGDFRSNSQDFLKAYEIESEIYANDRNIEPENVSTPMEYYAEAFKLKMTEPNYLESALPLTDACMNGCNSEN